MAAASAGTINIAGPEWWRNDAVTSGRFDTAPATFQRKAMFLIELEENSRDPLFIYMQSFTDKIMREIGVRLKDGEKVDCNVRLVVHENGGFSQELVDGEHVMKFKGELVRFEGERND